MTEALSPQLIPVTDPADLGRHEASLYPALDGLGHLNGDFLVRHQWVAVPVESASHFTEDDAKILSDAMQATSVTELLAIAAEELRNFPNCFEVPVTTEGLLAFSWAGSHFNFALSPPRTPLVILCTVYDYYLVAGPTEFVRRAVGGDISAARQLFDEFADGCSWYDSGLLSAVAERYRRQ